MTDPITDMLNRIRNAQAVRHETVNIPYSNLKQELAAILVKQGFVAKFEKRNKGRRKIIKIHLSFGEKGAPTIAGLKRISKPGRRIYQKWQEIRKVKGGYGIAVVSTSKGLMTGQEARRKKLGGEIICEVW